MRAGVVPEGVSISAMALFDDEGIAATAEESVCNVMVAGGDVGRRTSVLAEEPREHFADFPRRRDRRKGRQVGDEESADVSQGCQ